MIPAPVVYNAVVVYVHDGDTFGAVIALGDDLYKGSVTKPWPVRLAGCNAIELDRPGGPESASNLAAILTPGRAVVLSRVVRDVYAGRWDAAVETSTYPDLGEWLAVNGWVARYPGHGPKLAPPWPRQAPTTPPSSGGQPTQEEA